MNHLIGSGENARQHIADLTARGYEVKSVGAGVKGANDTDKAALLREFASALALPDWFGNNLDALLDALRDLESDDGRPIALVWNGASMVRRDDPQLYADVIDILDQVENERDDLRVTVTE